MPQNHDFLLAEFCADCVDEFVEVAHETFDRHAGDGRVAGKAFACAALLPMHDGEPLLEGGIVVAEKIRLGKSGTAMQNDEHRVRSILTADYDPLVDPAKRNVGGQC